MVLEDFPRLVSKFKKFVIGLSGGQDSVAVLHLLSSLRLGNREECNFVIEAVHVNHGLQKDAIIFQEFCQSLCSKLQINLHTKCIPDDEKEKKIDLSEELLKNDWNQIVKEVSKKRGSIGAQLSACIPGDLKGNNLEVISYDNSEFNQKLLQEGLELVRSIIDEKYGSNVNVSLVVDTEVEKIEDKKEEKVNEDDIVSLFDGKDML